MRKLRAEQIAGIVNQKEEFAGVQIPFLTVSRTCDVGVCSNRLIPSVLHEWREPRHQEFEKRNVWRLFNAFTESLKEGSLAELPKRTEALHGLLDVHVGLS